MKLREVIASARAKPAGVVAIAVAAGSLAILNLLYLALTSVGNFPLSSGAFLWGAGLETYGPAIFLIGAVLYARVAWGMWRLTWWSRYFAVAVAAMGIYLLVPGISAAVIDLRPLAIGTNGVQITLRVMAIWYLLQPSTREAFR